MFGKMASKFFSSYSYKNVKVNGIYIDLCSNIVLGILITIFTMLSSVFLCDAFWFSMGEFQNKNGD